MKDLTLQINSEHDFDVTTITNQILNTIYKLVPFLYLLYSEKTEMLNFAN